jgi:hypothetical protein
MFMPKQREFFAYDKQLLRQIAYLFFLVVPCFLVQPFPFKKLMKESFQFLRRLRQPRRICYHERIIPEAEKN